MSKLRPNQFTLPSGQVISEIPLLFQTEMVQAILEGRKTQTRRTRGLKPVNVDPDFWIRKGNPKKNTVRFWDSTKENNPNPLAISFGFKDPIDGIHYIKSLFGKPGDLLWVRETWESVPVQRGSVDPDGVSDVIEKIIFKADGSEPFIRWKPSIHMPKAAARIWLMVEEIRVERVQDISEADAIAEGVEFWNNPSFKVFHFKDYINKEWAIPNGKSSFQSLWKSINGEDSWNANPWVWVIKYRILSKTGRPSMEVIEQNHQQIASCLAMTRKEVSNG